VVLFVSNEATPPLTLPRRELNGHDVDALPPRTTAVLPLLDSLEGSIMAMYEPACLLLYGQKNTNDIKALRKHLPIINGVKSGGRAEIE
jgi:hypothetical protein